MMTDYAQVANGIVVYTGPLPDVGTISGTEEVPERNPDGTPVRDEAGNLIYVEATVEKPVSNFHSLDIVTLAANGWLPLVDKPSAFDPAEQIRTLQDYTIGTDSVTANWVISYQGAVLYADRSQIPPDGTTVATLTYRNPDASSPQSVVFGINGASHTEVLMDGVATVQVASATAGDLVQVTVADAVNSTNYLAPAITIQVIGGLA